jgi:hypothetical protein
MAPPEPIPRRSPDARASSVPWCVRRQIGSPLTAEQRDFSDELEAWLQSDGPKTIGALDDAFAEKSFAVAIVLLMFLPALPIPTGGITHVFEVITFLLAIGMVIGRPKIWLPQRFRNRDLGALATKGLPFIVRRVRWFEKFSEPRLAFLFGHRWFLSIAGLLVMAFTTGSAIAPPFSGLDTLPALGVVVIGLSIILEDIVVFAIGIAIGVGGIALIITLGEAAAHLFTRIF